MPNTEKNTKFENNNYENALITDLLAGDKLAFEKLYRIYKPMLYGGVIKMVKISEIADEIVQSSFIRIWEQHARIDPLKSFKSYLFTIAKHLVYDYFHQEASKRHMESNLQATTTEIYQHVEEDIINKEATAILMNNIEKLPPQRKQVYKLCKIEGKSYQEAAHMLGISCSTISDHIVKATKFLQSAIR
ncbi:RNA polymerase sigma-70 factor, ECF subfamily [bacterium A37T11]|nr:RNA polymerase sigma-70 factor, ECF subfamily [bacterium A37T11]